MSDKFIAVVDNSVASAEEDVVIGTYDKEPDGAEIDALTQEAALEEGEVVRVYKLVSKYKIKTFAEKQQ